MWAYEEGQKGNNINIYMYWKVNKGQITNSYLTKEFVIKVEALILLAAEAPIIW